MRVYLRPTVACVLAVILACGLSPGAARRSTHSCEEDGQHEFTPLWSAGDWWEVGYARAPRTRGHELLYNQGIDKPNQVRRFVVLGKAEYRGRRSKMIGSGYVHPGKAWSASDTLYFEESSALPLGSNHYSLPWLLPGPYVQEAIGFVTIPSFPEFPVITAGSTFVASRSVECHRGFGWEGWKYMGVPDGFYGPDYAVQVAREIQVLDAVAVLDSGLQVFDMPDAPYVEVRIVSGTTGQRLVRQVWHRDLPWPLLTEEGFFSVKPGWTPEPSPNPIAPPRPPAHTDINRDDYSAVILWGRAWLLAYGKAPWGE